MVRSEGVSPSTLARRLALVTAAAFALVAVVAGPAGAGVSFIEFDPDPAAQGETVVVTVVDGWPECNQPVGAPSYIRLDTGDGIIDGVFPGGTPTGTLVIPSDLAPGTYNVEVQCSFSLGNSVYYPTNPLEVVEAPPVTPTTETTSTTSTGSSQTAVASTEQSVGGATATRPRFTG